MCGIAGLVQLDGELVSPVLVKRMTDAIAHRGPDGEGQWVVGNVGIGHRRLAILDVSQSGRQPMFSQNERFVLSYNGEIYNFRELRKKLTNLGYQFRSETDSEVVVNAFDKWGPKAFELFNGMFAIAIWDRLESKLTLARDRYGIKPLYYSRTGSRFYFASEQKSFWADERYRRTLNKPGLLEYFTFQNFFSNQTLDKDAFMLRAGHWAVLDVATGSFEENKYWDFYFSSPDTQVDAREYEEELERLFQQAVERQLVSDVEVGSYLSGGIDSGAITAIAAQRLPNLKSFTVGFDLSSASGIELAFDERRQAESISAMAKTEQYEMVLKSGDMERAMKDLAFHLEEPRVGQSYPNYYAAKLASSFVKVVLSGTGGDELFGGYPWRYFRVASSPNFDSFIDDYYKFWQRLASNSELKTLFAPIWGEIEGVWTKDIFREVFAGHEVALESPEDYINHSLYFESKTFLHGLLVVEDKLSMAHGLETRVPFLDNDLVDFAMHCPVSLKLGKVSKTPNLDENSVLDKKRAKDSLMHSGKLILRDSLKKFLGEEVRKAKKQGFSSPDASWFRGDSLDYVARTLNSQASGLINSEIFSFPAVEELVSQHLKSEKNRRLLIWSLLYLANVDASQMSILR